MTEGDHQALAKALVDAVAAARPPAPPHAPVAAPAPPQQSWFSDNKMLGIIGAGLIAMMIWVFQDTKDAVEANRAGIEALTRNVDKLVTWAEASNTELSKRGDWMAEQNNEAERSRMVDKEHERALEDIKERLQQAK